MNHQELQDHQEREDVHGWFTAHVATYLADGLSDDERERFDAHAAACDQCAIELATAREDDAAMRSTLASDAPNANFEDRLIASLRTATAPSSRRLKIHPMIRPAATAVAATLLIAACGYVGSNYLETGEFDWFPVARSRAYDQYALSEPPRAGEVQRTRPVAARPATPESLQLEPSAHPGEKSGGGGGGVLQPNDQISVSVADLSAPNVESVAQKRIDADGKVNLPMLGKVQAAGRTQEQLEKEIGQAYRERSLINSAQVTVDKLANNGEQNKFAPSADHFKPLDFGEKKAVLNDDALGVGDVGQKATDDQQQQAGQTAGDKAAQGPTLAPEAPTTTTIQRKIIRNGEMEFEVDGFDAALSRMTTIANEEGGFVATTNSEKLPNGKVKGTIVLRVAPDRLDALVTKLRALGDLKSQNLTAQDITKQYTDLESQLRAGRAMEERLLEMIKTGKGEIKDLLAAEKELAVWRERIERVQGEINYYSNLVSLSTLQITLTEKDIRNAANVTETETHDMGIETEDVEHARADAIKAIDDAKGRIVESSLKQFDAGQLAARVVAEVSSEKTGEIVDRLRQLGKVARLDVQRATTTPDNRPAAAGSRVERKDTRIVASFYNLANVAPRVSSSVNIACDDVEAAYRAINERVIKANGRIITSNVNRRATDGASATIQFEVKSDDAEAVLNDIRAAGEVMRLESTQNSDTNNVTSAKRGFAVQLVSTASAPPRQVTTRSVAAGDVVNAYNTLLAIANKSNARMIVSQLRQDANQPASAILHFDARRDDAATIDAAIAAAGDVIGGEVVQSSDLTNTLASKVQYKLTLVSADQLPPRETTTLAIETGDADSAAEALTKLAGELGGRVVDANVSTESSGRTTARVIVELPIAKSGEAIDRAKSQGTVRSSQSTRNQQTNNTGQLSRARVEITFATRDAIVGANAGFWATIRDGLSTSASGLMWSLRMLVIGVCLVAPWVVVAWGGWKVARRVRDHSSHRARGEAG